MEDPKTRPRRKPIVALQEEAAAEERELEYLLAQEQDRQTALLTDREEMARLRGADPAENNRGPRRAPARTQR